MRVGEARAAAADWVERHGTALPGFTGAYLSGSTTWLGDGDELPVGSDVDVVVVVEGDTAPPKPGKFRHRGVLLEVACFPSSRYTSAEAVLADYHLVGGFRVDTILADPTGRLRRLRAEVARGFAGPYWVRRRCASVRDRIEAALGALDPSRPLPELVLSWLFPTGVTCHLVLVAALRNPTVRLRYLAARRALAEHGLADRYPELLDQLGCAHLDRDRVGRHVRALARTFDATVPFAGATPLFFRSDITPAARPIAIDGSWELIERGDHREAVFWIVATFARCHQILAAAAGPEVREPLLPAFHDVLADLGVDPGADPGADLRSRAERTLGYLPGLWDTAETIMAAGTG
ncbi:MAG: hypothetical protein ACJ73S_02240 [Mycobacteriales bacterium]